MNELLRECQSLVSCLNLFQEPGIWHRNCPESMPDQLPMGDQYFSYIICDVNAECHIIYSTSNNCRSKKAGEKHVQVCYNNIIPILIPTVCNYYKHNPEIHLWTKEYLITDYLENQNSILPDIQDTSQDLEVL